MSATMRTNGLRRRAAAVMAAALSTLVLGAAGCAAQLRFYDADAGVYHNWNGEEESAFRVYIGERHEPYREFRRLDRDQQRAYWKWRHDRDHGDHD